jgi:hypothetical protein
MLENGGAEFGGEAQIGGANRQVAAEFLPSVFRGRGCLQEREEVSSLKMVYRTLSTL